MHAYLISPFRQRYKEAKAQLQLGEQFFKGVLSPLADLSDNWRYFGFVCFPEVEDKNALRELTYEDGNFFSEDKLQVQTVITLYLDNHHKLHLEYSYKG